MYDYSIANPHVFAIKDNAGKETYCVKGKLVIDATDPDLSPRERLRLKAMNGKKAPTETFFQGDVVMETGDMIARFREMLPSTGTWLAPDGTKQPWNGTKVLKEGETFTTDDYVAACKQLFEEAFTFLPNGKWETIPLDAPVVQTFSRNFGKGEDGSPLFKKGEPVCYPGTKIIKVFKELQIFVRINDGGEGVNYLHHSYVPGWDYATRRDSKLRLYTLKAEFEKTMAEKWPGYSFLAEKGIVVNPDTGEIISPDTTDPAEV